MAVVCLQLSTPRDVSSHCLGPPLPFLRVISWRQELRKWDDVARDGSVISARAGGWDCESVTTVFVSVNIVRVSLPLSFTRF